MQNLAEGAHDAYPVTIYYVQAIETKEGSTTVQGG